MEDQVVVDQKPIKVLRVQVEQVILLLQIQFKVLMVELVLPIQEVVEVEQLRLEQMQQRLKVVLVVREHQIQF
tara:strand:+ start:376 stop:594 length:219 start_codon:yes stop_codon:yes gene_type:complete